MLSEQRYDVILKLLQEKQSITVAEVKELLHTSESTVRRDITALHNVGKLIKVFGGAVAADKNYTSFEPTVAQKAEINKEQKQQVARYAATLIEPDDFIYLDAGTTTGEMLDYILERNVCFVTNAVTHAQRLAARGIRVILVGGELKSPTEAVVGSQAVEMLRQYHFTKGFFGTNGISKKAGFTTPDANEALMKKVAMEQCKIRYVLGDHSKFGEIRSVTFAPFSLANIVTDKKPEGYEECQNITEVIGAGDANPETAKK